MWSHLRSQNGPQYYHPKLDFDIVGDSPDTRISDEPLRDDLESRDGLSPHNSASENGRTDDYTLETLENDSAAMSQQQDKEKLRRPSGDRLDYDIHDQQFEVLDTAGDQEHVDSASGSTDPLEEFSLEGIMLCIFFRCR